MKKFKMKKLFIWMMTLVLCCNMMCIESFAETNSTDGSDSEWSDGTQTVSLSLDKDSIMLGESVTISVGGDYYGNLTLTANGSPINTSYTPNAVGTVEITATAASYEDTENMVRYGEASASVQLTVSKRKATDLVLTGKSGLIWTGTEQDLIDSVQVMDGSTDVTEHFDISWTTATSGTDVGFYTVEAIAAAKNGDALYEGSVSDSISVEIAAQDVASFTVDVNGNSGLTYDGTEQDLVSSVLIKDGNGEDVTSSFQIEYAPMQGTDAGCYTVTATATPKSGTPYTGTASGSVNIDIAPRSTEGLTISAKAAEGLVYSSFDKNLLTDPVIMDGTMNVTDQFSITYSVNGAAGKASAQAKEAGNYTVNVTAAAKADGNYTGNTLTAVYSVEIAPKPLNNLKVQNLEGRDQLEYTGQPQELLVSTIPSDRNMYGQMFEVIMDNIQLRHNVTKEINVYFEMNGQRYDFESHMDFPIATEKGMYVIDMYADAVSPNFSGTRVLIRSFTVFIGPKDASALTVVPGKPETRTYNGESQTLLKDAATIKDGSTDVTDSFDVTYTLKKNNIVQISETDDYKKIAATDADNYIVEITYKAKTGSKYTGSVTGKVEVSVMPKSIENAKIQISGSYSYNGNPVSPDLTVTLNENSLLESKDYTVLYTNSSGGAGNLVNAGQVTATVSGQGNFTGIITKKFEIEEADLTDVKVEQVGKLTYKGQAQTPVVSASAASVDGSEVTFTYSTEGGGGTYSAQVPSFTNAGTEHTVYYSATADNHNTYYGSFLVEIEKAAVTEPTIAGKVYNGSVQTADIEDTDLYTVVKNDGGEGVKLSGSYDVVLELKDPANYKWSTTDHAQVTLPFEISQAVNEWTVMPKITSWIYGETATVPVGEAKFGEMSVQYYGTTYGGTIYSSTIVPTEAGSYKATFTVQETEDYGGLEKSVYFSIKKATYNMRGARWQYTAPFQYDGKEHKVEVIGLPAGVTVESYENNTATAVGDYYAEVKLAYDANNYNAPAIHKLGWTIYNDWTPTEYTVSTPNGSGWLNRDFVITANDGYQVSLTNTADGVWEDALTCSGETADDSVTFYLKNKTDDTISLAKTLTYKLDKTVPTGKVEFVGKTGWEEFVNTITFGLLYKDNVTVQITANDNLSGVEKIEYAFADSAMTLDEVKVLTDWTEYTDSFDVTLEDGKKFVYFVRITDKAGNVTYLSTDGAEYDITAPVINGIEDGKTYYTTQKVTVIDKNINSITLNDEAAGNEINLEGNKEAAYTIVATDKVGNSTTVTVAMKPIKELAKATENLGNNNVTSADAPALKELVEKLDELIADPDTSDDGERETLEQHKHIAESLLDVIEDAAEALNTENTEKVKDVTAENVTLEDKTDLEKAKADLEKALEDNSGNYTEDEKKAIEDEINRIDEALEVIGNIEAAEELIEKKPENITKNDEDADSKAPATGDTSNLWLWTALLFISGTGIFGITLFDHKRKIY